MPRPGAYFFHLRRSIGRVEREGAQALRVRLGEFALQRLLARLRKKVPAADWLHLEAGGELARLETEFWRTWFESVPPDSPPAAASDQNEEADGAADGLPRGCELWWEQRNAAWSDSFQRYFQALLSGWLEGLGIPRLQTHRHRLIHFASQPLGTLILEQVSETDLSVLVLRLSGHPAGLLRFCFRECERNQQLIPPDLLERLPRHWQALRSWPLRSRRLHRLGVLIDTEYELALDTLRGFLLSSGLSRRAWTRLYRMPLRYLQGMAEMARTFQERGELPAYLAATSRMLAMLPPSHCRRDLPERASKMLLWCAGALASVTAGAELHLLAYLPEFLEPRELGHRLPYQLMKRLLLHSAGGAWRLELMLSALLQATLEVDELRPPPQRYQRYRDIRMSLQLVIDWLVGNYLALDRNQLSGGWPLLVARAERWHRMLQEQGLAEGRGVNLLHELRAAWMQRQLPADASWPVALPTFSCDKLYFKALASASALREEGQLMRHCVASYAARCIAGDCLIYAVSERGKRTGTLDVRPGAQGYWQVAQFKGPDNRDLEASIGRSTGHGPSVQRFLQVLREATLAEEARRKEIADGERNGEAAEAVPSPDQSSGLRAPPLPNR